MRNSNELTWGDDGPQVGDLVRFDGDFYVLVIAREEIDGKTLISYLSMTSIRVLPSDLNWSRKYCRLIFRRKVEL